MSETAMSSSSAASAPTSIASAAQAAAVELVSFAIGDDQYGVDIMSVREIKGWSDITALPNQPGYVRGVVNLRGAIVPIIDLRARFGQGMTNATPRHVVLIVQVQTQLFGLLADRVLDIVAFNAGDVRPVPEMAQSMNASFLSGLLANEGDLIALVELKNLIGASQGELNKNSIEALAL